jgi:hypothetical protein
VTVERSVGLVIGSSEGGTRKGMGLERKLSEEEDEGESVRPRKKPKRRANRMGT